MNTLFNTTFETEEASHHEECVRLRPQTYDLQESNVQLKLTIVDAVGFGDQINKDERQAAGRAARLVSSPSLYVGRGSNSLSECSALPAAPDK